MINFKNKSPKRDMILVFYMLVSVDKKSSSLFRQMNRWV